jgi:hypothetical protein
MVDGNLGRDCHPPDALPHGMPLGSLDEQITLAGVIVGRGNSERVEIATLYVSLNAVAIQMAAKKVAQWPRIE